MTTSPLSDKIEVGFYSLLLNAKNSNVGQEIVTNWNVFIFISLLVGLIHSKRYQMHYV